MSLIYALMLFQSLYICHILKSNKGNRETITK